MFPFLTEADLTTIAVTGASGHVGANLVRALLAQQFHVRCLIHRSSAPLDGLAVERVEGDLLQPTSLKPLVEGAEFVFHLAAQISIVGDPDGRVHRTNVEGPRNIADAAAKATVRKLVHFSSIHAFRQSPLDIAIDEARGPADSEDCPKYDASKAAGEREILAAVDRGLDATIVNPTGVIGPFDFGPSRMGQVFVDIHNAKLPSTINGGFDWVDVRDVAQSAISAMTHGRRGEKYIVSGHWVSVSELARIAAEVAGVKAPWFECPMWLARLSAPFAEGFAKLTRSEPLFTREALVALRANRNIKHDKAKRELGHSPRPFRESVENIYQWFWEVGKLHRRTLPPTTSIQPPKDLPS